MNQDLMVKASEIVRESSAHGGKAGFGICTLALIDAEGFPTTSVVSPAKSDGIRWLTIAVELDGNSAKRSKNCNRASICFGTAEHSINLVGEIEVITSDDVKREMWYDGLKMHFTGPDDPNYCVLKFTTKRYKLFVDYEYLEGTL